jgi:4-hydroxybenzoate polyprenyltransferase
MTNPEALDTRATADTRPFAKWWIYQRERFPIGAHAPLVLAFSSSGVCFSRLLRHQDGFPPLKEIGVAFGVCLLFFLGLRIADEFKDFEEDSRFRPYRPVPRGLVSLRELGWLGAGAALLQLGLALWLSPLLVLLLVAGWLYLSFMTKEFFVREWLKKRPIMYLWTHMLIMPIVDLFATACDWVPAGMRFPPTGLAWFLGASFFNGIVIEFGRKIRAPMDEETGVQTYSALWGRKRAVLAWLAVMMATGFCAFQASTRIHFAAPLALLTGALFIVSCGAAAGFLKESSAGGGKRFEAISGLWTLMLYLGLGLVPLGSRIWLAR